MPSAYSASASRFLARAISSSSEASCAAAASAVAAINAAATNGAKRTGEPVRGIGAMLSALRERGEQAMAEQLDLAGHFSVSYTPSEPAPSAEAARDIDKLGLIGEKALK